MSTAGPALLPPHVPWEQVCMGVWDTFHEKSYIFGFEAVNGTVDTHRVYQLALEIAQAVGSPASHPKGSSAAWTHTLRISGPKRLARLCDSLWCDDAPIIPLDWRSRHSFPYTFFPQHAGYQDAVVSILWMFVFFTASAPNFNLRVYPHQWKV